MPSLGAVYVRDVSGNTALLDTSGRFQINVAAGSITVNSGTVAVSGLFPALTLQSGAGGVSGIIPVALFQYDYGGANWIPVGNRQGIGASLSGLSEMAVAGNTAIIDQRGLNIEGISANIFGTTTVATIFGFDPIAAATGSWQRIRSTSSGEFRLRVSTEGRAPTYSVNAQNITLFSGTAVQVAPYIALMNFGSGTAIQSGSAYKIKSLSISSDAASNIASGQAIKWDVIRFNAFSGGGTLISGVAFDTNDPAYSGTLAGPTLMKNVGSGVTLDAVYFSYVTTTEGLYVAKAGLTSDSVVEPMANQLTNLLTMKMPDIKEIVIRSGFGFGVVQSSGAGYTQLTSGVYSFNMIYSVEG